MKYKTVAIGLQFYSYCIVVSMSRSLFNNDACENNHYLFFVCGVPFHFSSPYQYPYKLLTNANIMKRNLVMVLCTNAICAQCTCYLHRNFVSKFVCPLLTLLGKCFCIKLPQSCSFKPRCWNTSDNCAPTLPANNC